MRRLTSLAVVVLALGAARAGALTPTEMAAFRHTTRDIDAVATAMMSWLGDQVSRPERGAGGSAGDAATNDVDVSKYAHITREDLAAILVPQYIAAVPELDGWGHPYDYYFSGNISQPHLALVRSAGADGSFDASVYARGDIASLDEDLVWADGYFVRGAGSTLRDLRQKQVHLRSTVLNLGQAMMSWLTDQISIPSATPFAGTADSAPSTFDLDLYPPMTAAELSSRLVPQYISRVPASDDWGFPFDYYLDGGPSFTSHVMAIRSRGHDGAAEGPVYTQGTFPALDLEADTVWADGFSVRWPDDLGALLFLDDFESGDDRFWCAEAP